MTLKEGKIDEYKKKHDEVWPEISKALTNAGVTNYSIYFDKPRNTKHMSKHPTESILF